MKKIIYKAMPQQHCKYIRLTQRGLANLERSSVMHQETLLVMGSHDLGMFKGFNVESTFSKHSFSLSAGLRLQA